MYRINKLLKLNRQIYHTNDLAILWKMTRKNTVYTTIKRYVQSGILIPIYKGFYSTVPLDQLDVYELGKAIIHRYAYLSTESVLVQAGVIQQVIPWHTFVSDRCKKVTLGNNSFLFRQLKPEFLYHPAGMTLQNGVTIATPERAAADLLYFNPRFYFDVPEALDVARVESIRKEIGYK